jgi:hypothetical protein
VAVSQGRDLVGRILVLEDDSRMSDWLEASIHRELADLDPVIEIVETEAEFVLEWLPSFRQSLKAQPQVIVIDVMLRWTDPAPDQPPRPAEVIEGGFMRAGLRCFKLIRSSVALARTKVIFFSSLTEEDLESLGVACERCKFVPKDDGQAILASIRAAMTGLS